MSNRPTVLSYYLDMLDYCVDTLLIDAKLKAIAAALLSIVSWLGWLLGGWDQLVRSLTVLMVMDFVLGFWRAWRSGLISGDKMKHGLIKFLLYAMTIMTGVEIQKMFTAFEVGFALRDWMVGYLLLNEGMSCLEHLSAMGVPLPVWLLKRLRKYRGCLFTPMHPMGRDDKETTT